LLISTNIVGATAFTPAGNWADGIPEIVPPPPGNGVIDVPSTAVIHAIPKDIRRGYTQSRNFVVQKELPHGFVAQVGYVGTLVTRQFGSMDLNAGQVPGLGLAGQPLVQQFGRTATSPEYKPLGTTSYNALQATLQRRFAQGYQISGAYTWSKTMGVSTDIEGTPRIQALSYFDLNRAVLNFDRTHVFNLSGLWELPFGKGKSWATSGVASALLGGWQLNGIFTVMTGLPVAVTASGTSLNLPGSTQRADQVLPEVRVTGEAGPNTSYFDPMAFRPVTDVRFGNAGFNSLRGPGLINLDAGLFRDFRFTDRFHLQFRAEAFNFTNTPHWSNPAANVSSITYNGDGTIRTLGGFGSITSTNAANLGRAGTDERMYRLGLRLSF
jgi:hypothetical protein